MFPCLGRVLVALRGRPPERSHQPLARVARTHHLVGECARCRHARVRNHALRGGAKMNSPHRGILLALGLRSVALAVPEAQTPPERPMSVKVYVTKNEITVDNGSPKSSDHTKVWARSGGRVTFIIENHDDVAHTVRIPIAEFVPRASAEYKKDATEHPIKPRPKA